MTRQEQEELQSFTEKIEKGERLPQQDLLKLMDFLINKQNITSKQKNITVLDS
jgi:hypothetical protein